MKQIQIIAKAYGEKIDDEFRMSDVVAFIQGRYMVEALLCTVGNMFSEGKKFSYPDQAYSMQGKEEQLTEDEIQRQREQFIAMLQVMEKNFNSKKEEKDGNKC